jgi:sentrin-specific protease 1
MSSRSPESMSPFRSPDPSPTAYKVARIPRTPELPYATNAQPSKTSDEVDITKRLEGLLVTPEEDHDQGSSLGLSTFMRGRLAKQAKEREAKERAEALHAAKERRLIRRNPLRPLVQPLSQKWDEIVFNAQYELSPQRVLAKAIKGTELHKKDFLTLLGHHAWLNDEIINAYLEWIEDAANKAANAEAEAAGERPSDVPKFIAHNSFFYETLKSKGPNQTERLMKRRKAPGKSFMQVDTMFVPINSGNHWTVAVVRPIAKTIEFFDSMGSHGRHIIQLLREWLKFQLGSAYVEDEWKVPRTGCAVQNNGYDCGVFVCTNSLCVALGLDTSCYTEPDMTQQRRNIAAVLINRGFVADFAWESSGL